MARLSRNGRREIIAAFKDAIAKQVPLGLRDARAAMMREGKEAQRELAETFEGEQFFNEDGRLRNVKDYGPRWGRTKERRRLDMRRGHATRALQVAIASPRALQEVKGVGIRYSILLAGSTARRWPPMRGRDGRRLKRRNHVVREYAEHFAEDKAPGLGTFSIKAQRAIIAAADEAFEKRVAGIRRAATLPGSGRPARGRVAGVEHIRRVIEVRLNRRGR